MVFLVIVMINGVNLNFGFLIFCPETARNFWLIIYLVNVSKNRSRLPSTSRTGQVLMNFASGQMDI